VGNPLDIQQKGVTPISTVLIAATGIVTLCTVDVVVVWVWPTVLLRIPRVTQSHPNPQNLLVLPSTHAELTLIECRLKSTYYALLTM